eukprot:scaffold18680_cov73-Phaeocystis_antarctica.AAC.3
MACSEASALASSSACTIVVWPPSAASIRASPRAPLRRPPSAGSHGCDLRGARPRRPPRPATQPPPAHRPSPPRLTHVAAVPPSQSSCPSSTRTATGFTGLGRNNNVRHDTPEYTLACSAPALPVVAPPLYPCRTPPHEHLPAQASHFATGATRP